MTKVQKARFANSIFFAITGASMTLFTVQIPRLEQTLNLGHAQVGLVILLIGAGALSSMQFVGTLVDKRGSRGAMIRLGVGLGLVLILPGLAVDFWSLAATMYLTGLCIGGTDIAMNANALEVEKLAGKAIFSSFHAYWSIGGMFGAALGALALALELNLFTSMTAWGLIALALVFIFKNWLLDEGPHLTSKKSIKLVKAKNPLGFVFFVGALSASAAICEGVGIDWSALFAAEHFELPAAQAGFTVSAFAGAMALFRFAADKFVGKFGRIFVIRYGSALAAMGVAVAIFAPAFSVSLIGWAIAGLGIAAVVPQCMALGSELGPKSHQARNLSKVVGMTYAASLGGPAIIGFVAGQSSMQLALICGIVLSSATALGSFALTAKRNK